MDASTVSAADGDDMDYAMPRADDLPSTRCRTRPTPQQQPLGLKGCGEAGAIGSSAAVINAITMPSATTT